MKQIEMNLQILVAESFAQMKVKIITQCGLPMLCCAIVLGKLLILGAYYWGLVRSTAPRITNHRASDSISKL